MKQIKNILNNNLFITKPKTFIKYKNKKELINIIYNNNNYNKNIIKNSNIITIKINSLRIIQKCTKYSYGHCKWLIKYINQ